MKGNRHGYEHQRQRTELTPVDGVEERHEDHDGVFNEGFCRSAVIVVYMCARQRKLRPAGGSLHSAQVLHRQVQGLQDAHLCLRDNCHGVDRASQQEELIEQVNKTLSSASAKPWYQIGASEPTMIEYKSTLSDIIIDGDDRLENADWGDHAIAAFEKLGDYLNNIMNILEAAQKEIGK